MEHNGKPIEIKYIPFPDGAQGYVLGVTGNQPDRYLVLIDSTRCRILQYRATGHELAHIYLGHLDRTADTGRVELMELEATAWQWKFYRAYRDGVLAHES